MNRFMLEMLEEKQRKSFDYQVEQYLTRLRDDFQKEFLDKNLYVDLNGETRIEKKREPYLPEKAAEMKSRKARMKKEQEESDQYEIIPHEPLDSFINQWLSEEGANLLVILGEYGTGKTTFCRHMAHQIAVKRLETGKDSGSFSIEDPKNRIPLYFPLRYFEKNIEPFIVNRFSNEGITDIDYPAFLQRVNNDEFVVLLDGFDEMTQKIDADEKSKNFDKICKVIDSSQKCKIILTTREEYFQSQSDFEVVFKCRDKENYRFVYLQPFNDQQIQQYLQTHTENPEFYWKQIKNIFDLHDLAKRPVLLQLIVDHLPALIKEKGKDQPINASDLYEKCIQEELRRKSKELDFIIPDKYRLKILQKLAVWMFLKDELAIDVMLLEDELKLRQYFQSKTPWEFEKHLNEFLTFTFLIREGDNQYRISHKSFRDYLTSQVFVEEINSGKVDNFSRVFITEEVNRFILEQWPDRDRLLDLVLNAKELTEANQWQGTNAANVLLEIDRDIFRNRDLSRCRLTRVDFSDCDLTGTDFRQANLSHCFFGKKILSAKLTGVIVDHSFLKLALSDVIDLTPLKRLNQLTHLDLYVNQVRDLTTLKELKQLTYLYLSNNQVSDLTPLSELKKLTYLYLSDNQVSDLTPLTGLKQLTYLDLSINQVSDLTPLKELKQLKDLRLMANSVSDLTPLMQLKKLTHLDLSGNLVSDLTPLTELKSLKELDLSINPVSELTPLMELEQLKTLYLLGNPFSEAQLQALQQALPELEITQEVVL
ncbi:MAG: NACHT domain-containing protein [Candidatus Aminicenantes bacterium]|nr:NACHT domain-containing protein [Candidatus Aminicenantes bacterium]NIN18568.1 NACHT domain-containing protein [Candidatus Aminicenantes bacterium]NIN42465.1 NACHT domain-containing protein [Candidatus Aminicenantes bacterium]